MGATVYGRRALRRFERETGEQLVHASSILTTVDHRHLAWDGDGWMVLPQTTDDCGTQIYLGYGLTHCHYLFGEPRLGFTRGLMRGPCRTCGVDCGQLHRWDCAKLDRLIEHVNPDYWPKPVHRPLWQDDPRRRPGVGWLT